MTGWSGSTSVASRRSRLGDAGLVAAVRDRERPPTWLVTGANAEAVDAAVGLLDGDDLEHRYAVAVASR